MKYRALFQTILLMACVSLSIRSIAGDSPLSGEIPGTQQTIQCLVSCGTEVVPRKIVLDGWSFSADVFRSNVMVRLSDIQREDADLFNVLREEFRVCDTTNGVPYDEHYPGGDRILSAEIYRFAGKGPETKMGQVGFKNDGPGIFQRNVPVYGEVRSDEEVARGIRRNHAARMLLLRHLFDNIHQMNELALLAYVDVLSKLWVNPLVRPGHPCEGQGDRRLKTDGFQSSAEPLLWILSNETVSPKVRAWILDVMPMRVNARLHLEEVKDEGIKNPRMP